jgi:hypothetical protein
VLEELSIVTGIVVAFWTTYGTLHIPGEWSWRLPFVLQIIPGLVLGVGIIFLPFSPRWLCSKDRDDEALVALSKLRQLPSADHRIQREWFDIRAEVALHAEISAERHPHLQERTAGNRIKLEIVGWTDLFKSGCWRRTAGKRSHFHVHFKCFTLTDPISWHWPHVLPAGKPPHFHVHFKCFTLTDLLSSSA